jgi:hypothetical protein
MIAGMKKQSGLNASVVLSTTQRLIAEKTPQVVAMLPQQLEEIRVNELWRKWTRGNGEPFESFAEAMVARQPNGLGLGQYSQWIRPFQVYHLCDAFKDLQKELRHVVVETLPAAVKHGGARRGVGFQVDNVNLNGGGNDKEYLLRKLKRHDAEHGTDFAAQWARGKFRSIRSAAIEAGIVEAKQKIKGEDSDRDRSPVDRVKMYWNRASVAERKAIAKMIRAAGTKSID